MGLDEKGALVGVQPRAEPVENHVAHITLDPAGAFVVARQGMPVRHKKETLVLFLQGDPIFQGTEQISKV
jgi:hypothetical protein